MSHSIQPGQNWDGVHFSASADANSGEGQPQFHFSRRNDRVLFTFSEAEWLCLKNLFTQAFADLRLQPILDQLSFEYSGF